MPEVEANAKAGVTRLLDAATAHPHERKHALLNDVYLAQDLLLCEPFEVNKALVADAAVEIFEQARGAQRCPLLRRHAVAALLLCA